MPFEFGLQHKTFTCTLRSLQDVSYAKVKNIKTVYRESEAGASLAVITSYAYSTVLEGKNKRLNPRLFNEVVSTCSYY